MWSTLINQLINILLIEYSTLLIEYRTKSHMIILTNVEKGIWQNPTIFLDKKYSKKPGNRKELAHLDKGDVQKNTYT